MVGLTGGTLGLMTPQGVIRPRVPRAAAPAAGSWGGLQLWSWSFVLYTISAIIYSLCVLVGSVCSMRLDTKSSLPGHNI